MEFIRTCRKIGHKIGQERHDLYINCNTSVMDASCSVLFKLVHDRFWKFLNGFYNYVGMAAILVMFPELFIYTLVTPSYRCFCVV